MECQDTNGEGCLQILTGLIVEGWKLLKRQANKSMYFDNESQHFINNWKSEEWIKRTYFFLSVEMILKILLVDLVSSWFSSSSI